MASWETVVTDFSVVRLWTVVWNMFTLEDLVWQGLDKCADALQINTIICCRINLTAGKLAQILRMSRRTAQRNLGCNDIFF